VAASQVTINLGKSFVSGQISVAIRISRELDLDEARALVLSVVAEALGEQNIVSCHFDEGGWLGCCTGIKCQDAGPRRPWINAGDIVGVPCATL
jgi:hypothetical protein